MSKLETLSDRAVIRLSGDDRRSFLQGLITQDVDRLADADAIFAALLTPQGKILFDFFVANHGDALLLDCAADAAPSLLKRLSMYKLRARISLEIMEDLKVAVSETPVQDGYADPRHEALGWRLITKEIHDADQTYERRRISLGAPESGEDFASDEMFLTDVNFDMLGGVSYKKGCFIGQEVTSRMKRKGELRRRTLIAELTGPLPDKGAAITAGPSTIGVLMSGAGDLALASIRLDRLEKAKAESTPLECSGGQLRLRVPDYLEQG